MTTKCIGISEREFMLLAIFFEQSVISIDKMKTSTTNTALSKEQRKCRGRFLRYLRKHYGSNIVTNIFPHSRQQRLRKLAVSKSVPIKQVYSWKEAGCQNVVKSHAPLIQLRRNDVINKPVSKRTYLATRLHIGRYNAGMMFNTVMKVASQQGIIPDILPSGGGIMPVVPTFLVVVDTTRDKTATEAVIESIYRKKSDKFGICMLQTGRPNESIFIPTIKIDFASVLDRPADASKALFGSHKKNARIFADSNGINTASLQMLDRYLSEAKKTRGIDYKMIVLQDQGLSFEEVKDFVHCHPLDFVATVASRAGGMKLEKFQ